MDRLAKPINQYYYSEKEWSRLGCGPIPKERQREQFLKAHARGNPSIDGKNVKGSN
jgi:hypothetical protein